MTALAVAAVWALAGVAAATVLPALRLRRLAVLVPFLGLAALVTAHAVPGVPLPGGEDLAALQLDRTAQGLLMAMAVSTALSLVLANRVDGPELATIGITGGAAVVAVSATSPVVWALGLFAATAGVSLRWAGSSPSRVTLASVRVALGGAALLVAAAALLPATSATPALRPVVVGAVLACGLASLLGLLPLGGWAGGGMSVVRPADAAVWPLLLAPAALLVALRVQLVLAPAGAAAFGRIVLTLGLFTALWSAYQGLRAQQPGRYTRAYIADLGLAAAAIGSGHLGLAQAGGLFLMLSHLVAGPLLLQPDGAGSSRARRLSWLLLCGLPPAPSFWGRLLLLQGLSQVSAAVLAISLLAMGLLFLAAVLGAGQREALSRASPPARAPRLAERASAWLIVAAGVALGLFSRAGATFIFGGS